MREWVLTAALAAALLVSACATERPSRQGVAPPAAPFSPRNSDRVFDGVAALVYPPRRELFGALSGWSNDDHVAAFRAFRVGCASAHDARQEFVCAIAAQAGPVTEPEARTFFERYFRPEPIRPDGLLTAYFTPVYPARTAPGGEFTAPVRPRPADLPAPDLSATAAIPYADRTTIEARPARDALAWMRPEDLFFLQIQGSGVLVFPGGVRAKALFDGSNGAAFRGVAAPMRQMGLLRDQDTSGEAIRAWLAAHRGPEAETIMRLDPRYVFLRLTADDGAAPTGAAGVSLIAGRSLAIDLTWHALGEVLWIDATSPALAGAFPVYRRLAVALDTGGAINGEARADLYLGEGAAAGVEAGRVRHDLRLYRLAPVSPPSR